MLFCDYSEQNKFAEYMILFIPLFENYKLISKENV